MSIEKHALKVLRDVASEWVPNVGKMLTPPALKFLSEYRKTFDIDKAFDGIDFPKDQELRDAFLTCKLLQEDMRRAEEWAQFGREFHMEGAIARYMQTFNLLYAELERTIDRGGKVNQIANPIANLLKSEFIAHGMSAKDHKGQPVTPVQINLNMQGTKELEVIEAEASKGKK